MQDIKKIEKRAILVINKIDLLKDKCTLLPYIKKISEKMNFLEIVPLSAKKKINTSILDSLIKKYICKNKIKISKNTINTSSKSFMISEIIREKIVRFFGEEIPYSTIVKVSRIQKEEKKILKIFSYIIVKRNSQKKILIGKKGNKIKLISTNARMSIEKFFKKKTFLNIQVKITKKTQSRKK
ncbi:hypothetical protein AOQ89_01235 [bacterium endosymbiont of Pedicinus badii]|nr:hypothetical protein AOQ89_01235 [bacterium endosymbiont of Pedicinus badii]